MILKMKTEEEIEVCNHCLCFSCEEKGTYPDCNCPCSGYPKNISRFFSFKKKPNPLFHKK